VAVSNLATWELEVERDAQAVGGIGRLIALRQAFVFLTLGAAIEVPGGGFRRLSGVILLTPVDTGRARASWDVYVADEPRASAGAGGQTAAFTVAQSALSSAGIYKAIWITSNLPYIEVLEYGGYPDPVARGSFVNGKWVIKSVGGFSRQAPQGMVRITVQQVVNIFREMGLKQSGRGGLNGPA
jgi:hypothetical protein